MSQRVPITYTFGNHMHWVDMEWLWGYHVLPGSVRDMLHFCRETGAKGNVNFDGVGYEKLAVENPEAFAELRQAVREGTVEVVGGSYGQPYGLFHGGESNIRQRVYGARTIQRLFGKRPETFWEEEFDFFPQLPQMLAGCGFKYASLFFQWTWHTPEVPREEVPVVWWEGQDGSRLRTATRNRLNLHQWPEDIQVLMDELAETGGQDGSLILQWLELMPSPDWMCRSEVLLPKTKELLSDPRFEVRFATLGEYLAAAPNDLPTRRYGMDDVWHGMTLGKNGDRMRRLSRECEASLLTAETVAAIAGLLGRPYAQWDVYPTWELEESWRELLQAQHHDNCECEGLCGRVGLISYSRSRDLSGHVKQQNLAHLVLMQGTKPSGGPFTSLQAGGSVRSHSFIFNPHGWTIDAQVNEHCLERVKVPPFGYVIAGETPAQQKPEPLLENGVAKVSLGSDSCVEQFKCKPFPEGVLSEKGAFHFSLVRNGELMPIPGLAPDQDRLRDELRCTSTLLPDKPILSVDLHAFLDRPDGGMTAGLTASINLSFRPTIFVDQPYGISQVHPRGTRPKKYPTGDWMTSPQWFEEVAKPFEAFSLVDLVDVDNPERGLLIVHDGAQQWFLGEANEVKCLVHAYDPWDEDAYFPPARAKFWLIPHGQMSHAEKWRTAQELLRPAVCRYYLPDSDPSTESQFSLATCEPENVVMTALYRETLDSGHGIEGYAADWEYPYILRLVEFDGIASTATIQFTPTVARAIKTDLMGANGTELTVEDHQIAVPMRPYEIATIYLDLVEGRKQTRDLDAKRKIWATVHRRD